MFELRNAQERGVANFGWLDSKHTFSFGSYYDAQQMGFSALRVINDDTVAGGAGFATHGHKDMEIISFVTQGVIEHQDSMGNVQTLPQGEFQLMSAGSGVYHSEYNGSASAPLKFLQIWIEPNERGTLPGYQQKDVGKQHGLTKVITPTGENGTLKIRQQASLSQLVLAPAMSLAFDVSKEDNVYIHVVEGNLAVDAYPMQPGDGLKIQRLPELKFVNRGDVDVLALVFVLP